jgi:hypothetical protein
VFERIDLESIALRPSARTMPGELSLGDAAGALYRVTDS